jgi:hypothetical protein
VDDADAVAPVRVRLRPMSIEVPPEQLYALAAALRAQGDEADDVAARLAVATPEVAATLAAAVAAFLEAHRVAGGAVAGELRWLGGTIAATADSWLGLDGSLLAPRGEVVPQ